MGGWPTELFDLRVRPSSAVLALATLEMGRDAVEHDAITDLEPVFVCANSRLHDEAECGWRIQQVNVNRFGKGFRPDRRNMPTQCRPR